MVDPRLYSTDSFVVLEPQRPDQLMSAEELTAKLQAVLASQETLPYDLARLETLDARVQYLLDTACEFKPETGGFLEWYAVQLGLPQPGIDCGLPTD